MNCAEFINFWLSVCRCFTKRKPIFYYFLTSMLDVPTFCWFPWADVPSASISFLYLSDSFLFSLKLWLKCFQVPLIFQRLLWNVLLFSIFWWFCFLWWLLVLALIIYNYFSYIVIPVYGFSNNSIINYCYIVQAFWYRQI